MRNKSTELVYNNGQLVKTVASDGTVKDLTYDGSGNLTQIDTTKNGVTVRTTLTYANGSLVKKEERQV